MNRIWRIGVLLTLAIVYCQAGSVLAQAPPELKWQMDYVKAHEMRVATRRPMLVFLTMDGCPFCNKMLETTYRDQQVAREISDAFVPTYINGSHQQQLAQQFGVRIYPTTYVIGADNQLLDRIEGYLPADKMRQRISMISRRVAARPDEASSKQ